MGDAGGRVLCVRGGEECRKAGAGSVGSGGVREERGAVSGSTGERGSRSGSYKKGDQQRERCEDRKDVRRFLRLRPCRQQVLLVSACSARSLSSTSEAAEGGKRTARGASPRQRAPLEASSQAWRGEGGRGKVRECCRESEPKRSGGGRRGRGWWTMRGQVVERRKVPWQMRYGRVD